MSLEAVVAELTVAVQAHAALLKQDMALREKAIALVGKAGPKVEPAEEAPKVEHAEEAPKSEPAEEAPKSEEAEKPRGRGRPKANKDHAEETKPTVTVDDAASKAIAWVNEPGAASDIDARKKALGEFCTGLGAVNPQSQKPNPKFCPPEKAAELLAWVESQGSEPASADDL